MSHHHFQVIQNEEGYIPDDNFASHLTIEEAFKDAIERAEHYRDTLDEPSGKLLETLNYDIGLLKITSSSKGVTRLMFNSGDLVISIDQVDAIWCLTHSP